MDMISREVLHTAHAVEQDRLRGAATDPVGKCTPVWRRPPPCSSGGGREHTVNKQNGPTASSSRPVSFLFWNHTWLTAPDDVGAKQGGSRG